MEQARQNVTDIAPRLEVPVFPIGTKTFAWLDTLYKCGLVSFGKENEVVLNEEIRDLIRGVHAVLAGGKVSMTIEDNGGMLYEQLEEIFQIAHDQVNAAYMSSAAPDDITPFAP